MLEIVGFGVVNVWKRRVRVKRKIKIEQVWCECGGKLPSNYIYIFVFVFLFEEKEKDVYKRER